jgi:NTP pyrophosphatase (non-canonical NTP hydrolase)
MTVTITSEYLYLTVTLILMLIQVIQWRKVAKLKRELEDVWAQIGILAMSAGGMLDKIKKDLDGKQDK